MHLRFWLFGSVPRRDFFLAWAAGVEPAEEEAAVRSMPSMAGEGWVYGYGWRVEMRIVLCKVESSNRALALKVPARGVTSTLR